MAQVSATRNSSQSRNQLLAALSAADFASLQPHLKSVPMPLLKNMERPNQRIETVYFMETGIASVVGVQPDETRVEVGLIGREGMSGMAIVLGDDQSPHATYVQVAGEGQRITANELRKAMTASQTLHSMLRGERIEHFETVRRRKHGSLITVALTVSPVRDAEGKIVGASKIARDITAQRRSHEQIATLAREAEHRSKNLLATVQAIVHLSQSETPDGLKRAIEGRIQALANVHSLFVKSRWIGAELSTVTKQELTPYMQKNESRVSIEGPEVLLEPNSARAIAVTLHELATNAVKYGALSATEGQIEVKWSHTPDRRLILV
jgi:HWE histidine kinase/PAS fold